MSTQQSATAPTPLDEATVCDYLRNHPDFLGRHRELLGALHIPHESGGAVSLIERQVEQLRDEVDQYKRRLAELIDVARENDELQARMHRLTLALIDAQDFDEVVDAIQDELHDDFHADAVEIRLFSDEANLSEARDGPGAAAFAFFFENMEPVCGPLPQNQLDDLFGAEADDVRSAALVPLKGKDLLGLLAIGSTDPERFSPTKSTDYLARLGETISKTLQVVSLPGI